MLSIVCNKRFANNFSNRNTYYLFIFIFGYVYFYFYFILVVAINKEDGLDAATHTRLTGGRESAVGARGALVS